MPSLRSIANQYHHAANRIAARGDRIGSLTNNQKKAIDGYRDAASKIEALIRPEDTERHAALEIQAQAEAPAAPKKFKAHKAATPQELLEMAQ